MLGLGSTGRLGSMGRPPPSWYSRISHTTIACIHDGLSAPATTVFVSGFDEENDAVHGTALREADIREIAKLPNGVSRDVLHCSAPMSVERESCEHTGMTHPHYEIVAVSSLLVFPRPLLSPPPCPLAAPGTANMRCGDAYFRDMAPCPTVVDVTCPKEACNHVRTTPCTEYCREINSGQPKLCENLVSKLCSICRVNSTSVQCYRDLPECSRDVTKRLDCGHDVSWKCGDSEDPTTIDGFQCRGCLLPMWKELAEYAPTALDVCSAITSLKAKIQNAVTSLFPESEFVFLDSGAQGKFSNDFENHLVKVRRVILMKMYDILQQGNGPLPELPPVPTGGCGDFLDSYDIVISTKDDIYSQHRQTKYGAGTLLRHLTPEAVRTIHGNKESADGSVTIIVGVAFRNRALDGTPQFAPGKMLGNGKASDKKACKAANRVRMSYMDQGYDSVVFENDKALRTAVYWHTKQCMAFASVKIKLCRLCHICRDIVPDNNGFLCLSHHIVCWDCMRARIAAAGAEVDVVGRAVDDSGNMTCAECQHPITAKCVVSADGPADVQEALEKLKIDIISRKRIKEELAAQEMRLKAEFDEILRLEDADERDVATAVYKIVNEILTLKCPRCKMAFDSFVGCFALTCANSACRAGFCAWCLADCNGDAHRHVAQCRSNPCTGNVFGTLAEFSSHHDRRRREEVKDLLSGKPEKVKKVVFEKLEVQLKAFGILAADILVPAGRPGVPRVNALASGSW